MGRENLQRLDANRGHEPKTAIGRVPQARDPGEPPTRWKVPMPRLRRIPRLRDPTSGSWEATTQFLRALRP